MRNHSTVSFFLGLSFPHTYFFLFFKFPFFLPLYLHFSKSDIDTVGYMVRFSFDGHLESHLQNRSEVSIAEHPHGSPFSLAMKIATTERIFKTRSNCLVLLKKDPDG